MSEEIGMHAVDSTSNVLFSDFTGLDQLLDKDVGGYSVVCVFWHVAILCRYEDLVS